MQKEIKQVTPPTTEGRLKLPPKWRLSVSARPSVWNATETARCRQYRLLAKYGEASVRYVLCDYKNALGLLDELAKHTKIRQEHRDEIDLPLLSFAHE